MTFQLPHTSALSLRAYHCAREAYANFRSPDIADDEREAILTGWLAAQAELLIREIGSDGASRVVQQVATDAGLAVRFSVRPAARSLWRRLRMGSWLGGFVCGVAVVLVIGWPA